jgi:type II secretory pathway pseudopilin PulG
MSELSRAARFCAPPVHSSSANRSLRLRFQRTGAAAFTILELLLALAIIALLGTVLIGGSAQLLNDKPISADEVFWKAVQEARKDALKTGEEVRLTFVDDRDKGKAFVVTHGTTPQPFPLPPTSGADLTVSFLTTQKGASSMLVAGQLVETQTVPAVLFYGDGTCTAFRAQFQRGGSTHLVSIDPWTCAPMLTPNDPNAPLAP